MIDPVKGIEELERHDLEGVDASPFELSDALSASFLQIRGLADFWSQNPEVDFAQTIIDLVVSAHSQAGKSLIFVLVGASQRLSIYISLGDPEMTQAIIEGALPGVSFVIDNKTRAPKVITNLASLLAKHVVAQGVIGGIPSRKAPGSVSQSAASPHLEQDAGRSENESMGAATVHGTAHLERVIRGMSGSTWAYIVRASPRHRPYVMKERLRTLDELAQAVSESRRQLQRNIQQGKTLNPAANTSISETVSGEVINYRTHYLAQLLEQELRRYDRALALGQWVVEIYVGAADLWELRRLSALLIGTLTGKDSRPRPLRAHQCVRSSSSLDLGHFLTSLSSEELATCIQLPRAEAPGYAITDHARFDVDFSPSSPASLPLGMIQQNSRDTGDAYCITLNDLTKHAVVVGVTGSGKTTTILNLLDHAASAHVPLLVIEPAKTEYRPLRHALAGKKEVRVYTLGNENVAPFRLNPFEFETDDEPGSDSLLSHIDFLKAVFNAAFELYPPMPYVLEMALHAVYQDKGWELASGRNTRLSDSEWSKRHHFPIFPTLTELYRKVLAVTLRLGYYGEVEQNTIAGLQARIGSLRLGAKGFMLNTPRGIPMETLLSLPTVLELESIGNDDEKTFLMGLFLARLYEYRRLQAARGMLPPGLQHLLIFEEAHRLLKHTATQVDNEKANPRAQAIETFTNMLSEIRGYGQGVIVAEQIPSKLAPDVLKNTNLKIAHRLVAGDDRQSVGQTMNFTAPQSLYLGTLSPGMAAVYAEGADHAYLVRMENYRLAHGFKPLRNAELAKTSAAYASVEDYLAIPQMFVYGIKRTPFHGPDSAIYEATGSLIETESCKQWLARLLVVALFNRSQLLSLLDQLPRIITSELPQLHARREEVRLMALVRGCAEMLHERGAEVGWSYPFVEELRQHLTQSLVTLFRTRDITRAAGDLDQFYKKYTTNLNRPHGPFPGCCHCEEKCIYRLEVRRILSAEDQRWIERDIQDIADGTSDYEDVAKTALLIGEQWLEDEHVLAPNIGYCGALHAVARLDDPPVTTLQQAQFADRLAPHLLL
ncbi:MAG TPA: DUF87 domain-containing protein [Ktedonobacteraceae bacterium]|nr:DUF87 domain-containing protein [Ktedonobacteraceae bacterium]